MAKSTKKTKKVSEEKMKKVAGGFGYHAHGGATHYEQLAASRSYEKLNAGKVKKPVTAKPTPQAQDMGAAVDGTDSVILPKKK